MTLIPFHSDAIDTLELGADALLYVMAYGHTIGIDDRALRLAEKVAIVSLRRRLNSDAQVIDPPIAVLRDVNRAIDVIAASLRAREAIDREAVRAAFAPSTPTPNPSDRPNEGPMAPLRDRPLAMPPSGQKVTVDW